MSDPDNPPLTAEELARMRRPKNVFHDMLKLEARIAEVETALLTLIDWSDDHRDPVYIAARDKALAAVRFIEADATASRIIETQAARIAELEAERQSLVAGFAMGIVVFEKRIAELEAVIREMMDSSKAKSPMLAWVAVCKKADALLKDTVS